jgi:hypothetical protein
MNMKKRKLILWDMENEQGETCESIDQALEIIVEIGLWGNDKKPDYPRHWLILENDKLLKTLRVDSMGRVSWTNHA